MPRVINSLVKSALRNPWDRVPNPSMYREDGGKKTITFQTFKLQMCGQSSGEPCRSADQPEDVSIVPTHLEMHTVSISSLTVPFNKGWVSTPPAPAHQSLPATRVRWSDQIFQKTFFL